jgi:hypothetical protein
VTQPYILEKPHSSFDQKEIMDFIFSSEERSNFDQALLLANRPVYLYWDKIKYKNFLIKAPIEKTWAAIKFMRWLKSSPTVIKAENTGNYRWYPLLPGLEEFLHKMDLNTGGHLSLTRREIDKKNKMQFISRE